MRKFSNVVDEVLAECARQKRLQEEGKFKYTCVDAPSDLQRFAILGEEFGEVAREVVEGAGLANDLQGRGLKKELIQVAAICVSWLQRDEFE